MKKRNVVKLLVLTVAVVMLVSILVACGETSSAPSEMESAEFNGKGQLVITLTDGTVWDPIDVNNLHTYGEWYAFGNFKTTCDQKIFYHVCTKCNSIEFKQGSEYDHDWEEGTVAPTCQIEGYDYKRCTICDKEERDNVKPKVDHDWDITTIAPTCTTGGYDIRVCSECELEEEYNHTPITHAWETVVIEPTCERKGYEHKTCTICGEEVKENYKPFAHNWETVTIESTCLIQGYEERTCTICGEVEKVNYQPLGDHKWDVTTIESTCLVEGYDHRVCSVCDKEEDVNQQPLGDHKWSEYQSDNTFHWKECEVCEIETTKVEHVVDDSGYCTTCNGIVGDTVGIIYDLSTDGPYAEVIGYEGSAKRVIIASEYNGKPVKSIYSEAFRFSTITSVYIPDSVTSIGDEAFRGCDSLTSVTIPDSVTSIGDEAFSSCESLSSVTIGNSVTSIGGYAFAYCDSLSSVTIGNSVTSIGERAFAYCYNLTSVHISSIESWCSISFYDSNKTFYDSNPLSYGAKLYLNGEPVEDIVIPNTVTEIKDYAFRSCTSIKSVTIPDSVISIGEDAFYYFTSLSSVNYLGTIEQWCGITFVNEYANPLYNGAKLYLNGELVEDLVIPNTVTEIKDNAFYGGTSITSVNYLGTIEQWCGITFGNYPANPLYNGAKLYLNGELLEEDLVIPNTVTEIKAYAFVGYTSLTSVTIPDSVTSIGNSVFYKCPIEYASIPTLAISSIPESNLKEVVITSGDSIGGYAFYECKTLTSVTIGNSVTSIGDYAFAECGRLNSVILGNSVTSIGTCGFSMTSAQTIIIPASLSYIGSMAFHLSNLGQIFYTGTEEEWNFIYVHPANDFYWTHYTPYYYSETEPVEEGNYWHYVDGIPTPW